VALKPMPALLIRSRQAPIALKPQLRKVPSHLRPYDKLSERTDLSSRVQLLKFFHRSLQLPRDLLGIDILLEA
jgi:hypothetical protein